MNEFDEFIAKFEKCLTKPLSDALKTILLIFYQKGYEDAKRTIQTV